MGKLYTDSDESIIWSDYKKFLGITWPFTKYTLTSKRMFIETGVLRYSCEEIKLFRVSDISLTKNILERILGLGSIRMISSDKSAPVVRVGSIKEAEKRRQLISQAVEDDRSRVGVHHNQFI